jgi:DNA polymerase I-like protein with 3'-5' exonuclease and polymerase domains
LDSENTTGSKGDAHDQRNSNVCWAYKKPDLPAVCDRDTRRLSTAVCEASTLVGFNLAYDLQWLWKQGISTEGKKLWCCQVAEFIINDQTTPYPSLDDTGFKYTGQRKLDVVKTEYWDKGINTDQIPFDILAEYAIQDVNLTEAVYLKQLELITPERRNLFSIAMQDMAVLAEMRWHGMKYDEAYARQKQQELLDEIERTKGELDLLHSVPSFNWNSSDHLSALLYGGTIVEDVRVPNGYYKTGAKVGQPKFKIEQVVYHLPRIYKPLPKTEAEKGGVWSTSEDVLTKLDDGTALISGILKIRGLSKLLGTYFEGIPKKATESHWSADMVHGQFNQCVAVTGRLSSTNPNLQNMPPQALKMFTSRYDL